MRRPGFFLVILLLTPAHALRDYKYPIARAALAHAGTRGACTAWQDGACSSYAQSHEDLAVYEQFYANASSPPEAPGVFVEMGALDGVTLSNTLAFERSGMNWTGVLIEANPALCEDLRAHRSRASTTLCTGVSGDFRTVWFERGMYTSTFAASEVVVDARKSGVRPNLIRRRGPPIGVASAPLGYLLRSVGVKYVDFFSLDVEGSEALALATMDWTIPVRVWCIEWEKKVAPASTNQSIAEIMTRNGYERRRWEHEDDGDRSLTPHNQLWVRTAPWEPATYSWRPWVRDG